MKKEHRKALKNGQRLECPTAFLLWDGKTGYFDCLDPDCMSCEDYNLSWKELEDWYDRWEEDEWELDEEPKEDPLPCPSCKSENIEIDSDGMVTSMTGKDYQNIWVECKDCGFNHVINIVDYPMEKYPTQLCIEQWNKLAIKADTNNP